MLLAMAIIPQIDATISGVKIEETPLKKATRGVSNNVPIEPPKCG